MDYYKSITQEGLVNLISNTKTNLLLCLPSIHDELASAIRELKNASIAEGQKLEIHILIDFDAQTIRQGYGSFNAIEELIECGIDVKTLKGNRISFIISDDIGYHLFIESRSLIPADKETINAVVIDSVGLVYLKKFFYNNVLKMDFKDELTNALIEESKQLDKLDEMGIPQIAMVEELEEEKVKEVKEEIEKNPPLNPDYKRVVEFYSNKFQYVKLKFDGANLQHRKIKIPSKALPINDGQLKDRLETKLNLFDVKTIDESFKVLNKLKEEIEKIREDFLTKVKFREESILDKNKKIEFNRAIKTIGDKMNETKKQSLSNIAAQITNTKNRLLKDLEEFLIANPKVMFNKENPDLWQGNQDFIQENSKSKAQEIIYRINWPSATTLVEVFKLDVQYSDITYEDLRNKDFINELKENGLINLDNETELANFGKGIETRN